MSRIILITGHFPIIVNGEDTGKTEFVVSHGINEDTGASIILPNDPPHTFEGSYYSTEMNEWILP